MGKLSGGVLILAGIAVGAYALWPQPRTLREIAAALDAGRSAARALAAKATSHTAAPAPPHTVKANAPVSPPAVAAPAAPAQATAVRLDETPPRVPVGAAEPAAPPHLDRTALTREIQRHLKRVGCYSGDVSGVWSAPVRRAMQAFTARVNASLPVEEPDPVLLAMVRSQEPGACGASCPSGQSHAADGRCLPTALMTRPGAGAGPQKASSAKRRQAREAPAAGQAPATAAYRPMEGRMGLAGPRRRVTRHRHTTAATRALSARAHARQRRAARRRTTSGFTSLPGWIFPF